MTDNGKPKYFSLMEQLRSDIMSGAIRQGEKLPSENELSQKYSLSRHTVRKALGILEQDGYVEALHGRGTYCSESQSHGQEHYTYVHCHHGLLRVPCNLGLHRICLFPYDTVPVSAVCFLLEYHRSGGNPLFHTDIQTENGSPVVRQKSHFAVMR